MMFGATGGRRAGLQVLLVRGNVGWGASSARALPPPVLSASTGIASPDGHVGPLVEDTNATSLES